MRVRQNIPLLTMNVPERFTSILFGDQYLLVDNPIFIFQSHNVKS